MTGLPDDLIKSIQDIIDSGKGDSGRLDHILNTLKKGKPLFLSDQKYLDSLLATKIGQQQLETESIENQIEQPKFCGKCGTQIIASNNFCIKCGFPTKNVESQPNTILQSNANQLKPVNIQRTNKKAVRKAAIGVIVSIIPIIILIYAMVNFTIPGIIESNQRVNDANNGVNNASMDVLSACDDLNQQYNNVMVEGGIGSEEVTQFFQMNGDGIKSCKTSLQSIQNSCKIISSMQVCKDPRLQELSHTWLYSSP